MKKGVPEAGVPVLAVVLSACAGWSWPSCWRIVRFWFDNRPASLILRPAYALCNMCDSVYSVSQEEAIYSVSQELQF